MSVNVGCGLICRYRELKEGSLEEAEVELELQVLIQLWGMLTLNQKPQRCCHGEPAHGPSSVSPVTAKIDNVAGIDYSLLAPPTATAEALDGQLKVSLTLRITLTPGLPTTLGNKTYKDSTPFLWVLNHPATPLSASSPALVALASLSFLKCSPPVFTPGPLHSPLLLPRRLLPRHSPTSALPSYRQVFTQISSLPGGAFSDHCH